MSYRFTVQRRHKNDSHYQVGLADTIDHADLLCVDYYVAHTDEEVELRIWDYNDRKWIYPSLVATPRVDKNWNPGTI